MTTPILEISDNVNTKSFLSSSSGFFLNDWNPAIAGAKGGGVFQSSSLSEGRQLAVRMFANATETFNLKIANQGQDNTIADIQDLIDLLENAIAFSTGDIQQNPVFIKAKAFCETNSRFALIVSYSWQELDNPFAQPFFGASQIALMDEIVLVIERGHWGSKIPGQSDCVLASSVQAWQHEVLWQVTSTSPTAIYSIENTANALFAGDDDEVWRSTDDGLTWATTTPGVVGRVLDLIEADNGNVVLAGDDGIIKWYDGAWNTATEVGGEPLILGDNVWFGKLADGTILAAEEGTTDIFRSIDNGEEWDQPFTGPIVSTKFLTVLSDDTLLLSGDGGTPRGLYKSVDGGSTWIFVSTLNGSSFIHSATQLANGNVLVSGDANIFQTTNVNTVSFSFLHSIAAGRIETMIEAQNGDIYVVTDRSPSFGIVYRSADSLSTSIAEYTSTADTILDLTEADDNSINGGSHSSDIDGNLFRRDVETVNLGRSATCTNEIYIANRQNFANLTHIKISDAGVFTDIFPIVAFPQNLLPDPFAVGDIVYFGSSTAVNNSGPFGALVFDLAQAMSSSGATLTSVWEYFNGAWVTLTTHDNTTKLSLLEVSSLHWQQPSDWTTESIDSITAYWIRLRITALVGTPTTPQQQNRDIYAIVQSFINIAQSVVAGEIPAILRQKIENQSDEDGREGSEPDLWGNRVICGLRSVSLGADFQAYLNISDEQNPDGVTVTATGANTTFVTDTIAPSGRNATYNPAGVEAMATQVTIALGPTIAQHFYGKFHAFLRVERTAGAITDFDVQLQFVSGSGGIEITTQSKQVQTTSTSFELLDFGLIKMPVGGRLKSTDLGDVTEIRIQASAASGTPNLIMYDVILIPVDEWAGDFTDFANNDDSIIGRDDAVAKLLDIDSLTNPKVDIQSLVRIAGNEEITSIYDPISPNKAILQANTQQRLWFLAAQTDQIGTLTAWIAPPEIAHSLQLFRNDRWLTMRGLE